MIQRQYWNKDKAKNWILLIGIFVVLPLILFSSTNNFETSIRSTGCVFTSWIVVWIHIGLFFILPLQTILPWRNLIVICLFFLGLSGLSYFLKDLPDPIFSLSIFYNTYNSLYLFGVKGIFEAWKRRKTKSFWWTIFLASPLLVVLGLTIFVGLFFVLNCF